MRPVATQVMHHVGQIEEEMQMGIDAGSFAHVMKILTDLYSNQILAVEREYSTNALDSNIEAGNTAPIQVILPTLALPQFIVKDQGLGLSVDDIRTIYAMYGSSTKRDSDAVTGMLGLGCKSGLTYALQFTVDAIKNGVRTIALVTKNAEGAGMIKILDTAGTDEPNGVTVTIPVKAQDVNRFRNEAYDLYRFWEPGTVLVDGEAPIFERDATEDDGHLWIDPDIRVSKKAGQSYVVMGNVPYPFDFPDHDFDHAVIAWVPMGTVDFTPSREALMTTSLTEDTLKEVRDYVIKRFPVVLAQRLENAASNWDRIKVWKQWRWKAKGHGIPGFNLSLSYGGGSVHLPKDRKGFRYDTYNDKANKYEDYVSYQDVADERVAIVSGFPNRSVFQSARVRFKQFITENTPGAHTIWIMPVGMTLDLFEGRNHVYTWDEILEQTDAPPKEKKKKGDTLYTFYRNGSLHLNEGAFEDDGTPLLYAPISDLPQTVPQNTRRWYSGSAVNTVVAMSKKFPEAVWVSIGENQVAKFVRLHDHAERYTDYVARMNKEALSALTDQDKLAEHMSGIATKLAADLKRSTFKVSDPDLRKMMKLGVHESEAITRCKHLGLTIPQPKSQLMTDIGERYPLLENIYSGYAGLGSLDDLILYLEAKWSLSND